MSIKQNGGVFGRNPTFNDVTIEGDLIINGEVFTGLDFQGSWNASTNTPALASSTGTNGEFYIVSVAGSTDLNGITNWGIGDWAIFNGTAWQRVEGGADGNFNDLTVAGSLSLGDNVKANFGAGDDLQIYHDGNNSRIYDVGTGDLRIQGTNLRLMAESGENYLYAVQDAWIKLYYNGLEKLATTATGIDVTGTATMDGLTVANTGIPTITIEDQDGTNQKGFFKHSAGSTTITSQNGTAHGQLQVFSYNGTDTVNRFKVANNGDINFYEDTGTTTKFFWDASAESLGIGTDSPATLLHLQSTDPKITLTDTSLGGNCNHVIRGADQFLEFSADSGNSQSGSVMKFNVDNAEAMRIDSSGNLLVGTADTAPATNNVEGIVLRNEGHINVSRASGIVGYFNRKTNDGDIISLHKDGTAVGSIGTDSNSQFIIGAGDTGLTFQSNTDAIIPRNTDGTARTQLINLGTSGAQFKDLYLSGGVYLGGTGTANKLDDYEEGTWTPTAASYDGTMTVNSASYVKVGKLVTVKAKVSFDATSDGSGVSITSLPFATTGAGKANGGFVTSSTVSSAARVQAVGSSSLFLMAADDSNVTYTAMASTSLEFVFIYEAA